MKNDVDRYRYIIYIDIDRQKYIDNLAYVGKAKCAFQFIKFNIEKRV